MDQKFGAAPEAEEPVEEDQGDQVNETAEGREVEVSLQEWKIVPKTMKFESGETVTFVVTNDGEDRHNFRVFGYMDEPEPPTAQALESGESTRVTLTFDEGGSFKYICAVPGHEALGMKGTLTVGEGGGGGGGGDGVPGFDAAVGVLAVLAGVVLFAATRRRK